MVPDFEPGKNAKYPRNTSLCAPSTSQIYPLDSTKIVFNIRMPASGAQPSIECCVLSLGRCRIRNLRHKYYLGHMFKAFDFWLPTNSTIVSTGPDWLHEVKYDGYRPRMHPGKHNEEVHDQHRIRNEVDVLLQNIQRKYRIVKRKRAPSAPLPPRRQ